MRLFFALELPAGLALEISDWRDRSLTGVGRPVPPANFHITLAFLGELDEPALDALCTDVDTALAARRPAAGRLQLDQVGYWERPGIYWLGPRQWPEALADLARKLGTLGAVRGGQRRRDRFQPHITLFRHCGDAPPAPATAPGFSLPYREFFLMQSRQVRRGVVYDPVAAWPLDEATL